MVAFADAALHDALLALQLLQRVIVLLLLLLKHMQGFEGESVDKILTSWGQQMTWIIHKRERERERGWGGGEGHRGILCKMRLPLKYHTPLKLGNRPLIE